MANFVTRVELHGAIEKDYESLHNLMAARGFRRTIVGGNGVTYKLPSATYSYTQDHTIEFVRDKAKEAANLTGKTSWVITTEGPSSWYLDQA